MEQYLVAFITGLTTGGLSCLAVQGGLLASSIEQQLEQQLDRQIESEINARRKKRHSGKTSRALLRPRLALPILLFLAAKLVAYTLLGFLLGALGATLQLNAATRAILLIGIGIFMVGNALRMFNVHPIFRFFAFEPPRFITRFIRRRAKEGENFFTPLLLGGLTVFIPCGVTQAMMAVALGTGNALQGAVLMFAFVLGTSPVFFIVAYLTMQLGARLEKWFMRFVAVVILVLGLVSVNSGLNLIGSPLAFPGINLTPGGSTAQQAQAIPLEPSTRLQLTAANNGYFPGRLYAKAGNPVTLEISTDQVGSCARDFVIPSLGYETLLPATGKVTVDLPPQPAGTLMRFTCSMGMYTGEILFSE